MEQCISTIFDLGRWEINHVSKSNIQEFGNVNISFKLNCITNKVKRNLIYHANLYAHHSFNDSVFRIEPACKIIFNFFKPYPVCDIIGRDN